MKDLFSGAFGKLNNHGGSRMFTTPNTRKVTPEYEITTDVPGVVEFVTCSLDGRLWVFRRSRRYYIAVFKWDDFTQKFGFIHSIALNNTNFIARGVDWLLTDNTIVQASDDEPYVFTANLFDDDGESFFYSSLRSKVLSSGIDPITKAAWGLSESNGNSEGYGYFKRSTLLQSVNKHYSMLPTVGDWHIIKNFLVRKADNPLTEAHNSMLNIRPLIPLEFNGSTPAHGCGFDNDIFLTYYNGELWGRGLYHIGRCYILPAVFDESGNPQEFYLYISPDYPRINVAQAEKLNLGVLKTADNVYGFLTSQASSLNEGLCYSSDDPKIFKPSAKQWQEISQSGQMFIDTLNHSGLVLNDDGAIFLNGASYECKGLQQWLAPAGIVDAASEQFVISSHDNSALAVYPQQGFHRESLAGKKLPLSAKAYSGKRLSLGLNGKTIQVNSSEGMNSTDDIAWQNIYKQPVSIRKINSFSHDVDGVFASGKWPVFYSDSIQSSILSPDLVRDGYYAGIYSYDDSYLKFFYTSVVDKWFEYGVWHEKIYYYPTRLGIKFEWGRDSAGHSYWHVPGAFYSCNFTIFSIDPTSGEYHDFKLSTSFSNNYSYKAIGDDPNELGYFFDENSKVVTDVPRGITIQDGQIGYSYVHTTAHYPFGEKDCHSETLFRPLCAVSDVLPDFTQNWQNSSLGCLSLQSFHFPKKNPENITCPAFATFSEKHSNAKFLHEIPSVFKYSNGDTSGSLADNIENDNLYLEYHNYWNIDSLSDDETYSTQGLHIAIANDNQFFVFRSELHPEIFDFKSETERSKLS